MHPYFSLSSIFSKYRAKYALSHVKCHLLKFKWGNQIMENGDIVHLYNSTFKREKKSNKLHIFSQTLFAQTDILTEISNERSENCWFL